VTGAPRGQYELRTGSGAPAPSSVPGEASWRKLHPEACSADAADPGTHVDGEPTIFVSVAAYRDPMCHQTLERALRWAVHPRRLRFAVVDQRAAGDLPCTWTAKRCEDAPEQLLCRHATQIRVQTVDAEQARGPTFGRHLADRMYAGEYFALQVDAHLYFVQGWDEEAIRQWRAAQNEYAVLSTYPSEAAGHLRDGESLVRSTPGICRSSFLPDGLIRHGAAGAPALAARGLTLRQASSSPRRPSSGRATSRCCSRGGPPGSPSPGGTGWRGSRTTAALR
jgi:hypothetical protein